jgi:predicted PhzF superfamily epimerase YddE/YHI9
MLEDPITGSLNAAIGCWMYGTGQWTRPVIVAQGITVQYQSIQHERQINIGD